jgi:hypothetical protein
MDRISVALFGLTMFMLGVIAASVYLWWALATGRRGIKLRNGLVAYPAHWFPEAREDGPFDSDSLANDGEKL